MKNINKIFSKLLGMLCHLTSKDFLTFIFYASFIFLLKRFIELQYLFLSRERDLHLSIFKINIIKNTCILESLPSFSWRLQKTLMTDVAFEVAYFKPFFKLTSPATSSLIQRFKLPQPRNSNCDWQAK